LSFYYTGREGGDSLGVGVGEGEAGEGEAAGVGSASVGEGSGSGVPLGSGSGVGVGEGWAAVPTGVGAEGLDGAGVNITATFRAVARGPEAALAARS
jgi:hypothetical protein